MTQRVQCANLEQLIDRFNNDNLLIHAFDPMTLSTNEQVFWSNEAFSKMLGYTREQALKMNFKDVTPKSHWEKHKKYELKSPMEKEAIDGVIFEKQFVTAHGELIDVSVLPTPLYDSNNNVVAYWVVFRDITQVKKNQEELFLFKQQYSQLLESLNLISVRFDDQGIVTDINNVGLNMLGWEKNHLLGQNWFDVCIPQEDRAELKQHYIDLLTNKREETRAERIANIISRDGRVLSINWRGTIFRDEHGNGIGTLLVGEDYSEKLKIESEKEKLVQNIVNISRFESVAQLVGGVAHEFNNVLSIILGFNKLALKSVNNEDEMKTTSYLIEVDKAGKRAAKLIEQLQAYSKKNNAVLIPTDLEKEVQDLLSLAKSILPTTIDLKINFAAKLGQVLTDGTMLHQSLMNLLLNAQEAMQSKGTIQLDIAKVHGCEEFCTSCHYSFGGDYIVVSIKNSGSHIPDGVLTKIFDPFFSTKGVGQGTGMGLSVVHGFVHASKGHITVNNVKGGGVEFKIYFPPLLKSHTEAKDSEILTTNHGRILVVDDEESLLFLYKRIFKNIGFEADCFSDLIKALEQFKTRPNDYALIITDQTMPGMLGLELIDQIKKIKVDIHSMLISGYSDVLDHNNQGKVDDYYIKPVDVSLLTGRIKELFSK